MAWGRERLKQGRDKLATITYIYLTTTSAQQSIPDLSWVWRCSSPISVTLQLSSCMTWCREFGHKVQRPYGSVMKCFAVAHSNRVLRLFMTDHLRFKWLILTGNGKDMRVDAEMMMQIANITWFQVWRLCQRGNPQGLITHTKSSFHGAVPPPP
jgi:hypothetical protein